MDNDNKMMSALADISKCADDLSSYIFTYGFDSSNQFYCLNRKLEYALSHFRNLVIEVAFKDVNNN